jgi:hypothetical protein
VIITLIDAYDLVDLTNAVPNDFLELSKTILVIITIFTFLELKSPDTGQHRQKYFVVKLSKFLILGLMTAKLHLLKGLL